MPAAGSPTPIGEAKEQELEKSRMTLGEHLEELRGRLFKCAVAFGICFALCWWQSSPLLELTLRPYTSARVRLMDLRYELYQEKAREEIPAYEKELQAFEAQLILAQARKAASDASEEDEELIKQGPPLEPWEHYFKRKIPRRWTDLLDRHIIPEKPKADGAHSGFFLIMRICTYFSLFITGPFLLWQLWQFIAAGLYKKERKVAYNYFPPSMFLFLGGVLFGYFVMVPNANYFLVAIYMEDLNYYESYDHYLGLLTSLTLSLGAVFQLPIIMLALTKVDLIDPAVFSKFRAHFIVGSLVISAALTPPDPFTQIMMAGPMVLLFEIGNILSVAARKKRNKADAMRTP